MVVHQLWDGDPRVIVHVTSARDAAEAAGRLMARVPGGIAGSVTIVRGWPVEGLIDSPKAMLAISGPIEEARRGNDGGTVDLLLMHRRTS